MRIRKLSTVVLLVLASFTTAFTAAQVVHAAPASASVGASSHTRLWWDGATCRAFAAGRIHVMVLDSRHADTYLRSDVALWAHDTHRHASRHAQELDRGYVVLDCAGSYGL